MGLGDATFYHDPIPFKCSKVSSASYSNTYGAFVNLKTGA